MMQNRQIKNNSYDIWVVNLNELDGYSNDYYWALSQLERKSAQCFVTDKLRRLFVLSHGWMRSLLSQYVAIPPSQLSFYKNHHGKPFLVEEQAQGLQFNLSHSRNMAALAVAKNVAIGVDIEAIQENFDWAAIAQRFFALDEYQGLLALPAEKQLEAFFRVWSCKEAFIKALGRGMSLPLSNFSVAVDPNLAVSLSYVPAGMTVSSWHVNFFPVIPHMTLAVALPLKSAQCSLML